jgi:hypothetical protein
MSEQQREDKQRYLRENILDRDFDAEEFMDFCESYRGSIDIDSWSLNELKEVKSRPLFRLYRSSSTPTPKLFKRTPLIIKAQDLQPRMI